MSKVVKLYRTPRDWCSKCSNYSKWFLRQGANGSPCIDCKVPKPLNFKEKENDDNGYEG